MSYEVHPAAALFPMMSGQAFEEFVTDIREHGQQDPAVLDTAGRLIDGRNRARACKVLRDVQGGTVPAALAKILAGMHNKKRRTNLLPEWVWIR